MKYILQCKKIYLRLSANDKNDASNALVKKLWLVFEDTMHYYETVDGISQHESC